LECFIECNYFAIANLNLDYYLNNDQQSQSDSSAIWMDLLSRRDQMDSYLISYRIMRIGPFLIWLDR